LRFLLAGKVQKNGIDVAVSDLGDGALWRNNLSDEVAGFAEDFLQDVSKRFVLVN
jgi:hypothetical protein